MNIVYDKLEWFQFGISLNIMWEEREWGISISLGKRLLFIGQFYTGDYDNAIWKYN